MNRSLKTLLVASLIVFAVVLAMMADSDRSESRIKQGLKIAPVKLNLTHKNPAMVGWGSYLVNAMGSCADCHSCPTYATGHNPYRGEPKPWLSKDTYLAGGVQFGPFTSANLTPDANGLPAGLTLQEFIHTLRTGQDPHPEPGHPPLLQVMPWPVLSNLTDQDLQAIYMYLTAIPHAEPGSCSGAGE